MRVVAAVSTVCRPASLSVLFDAASVAVVGASNDPSKVGGSVLANLRAGGFAGRIVAVNRARDRVQGMPAVAAITTAGPVDVAVIAVPADAVLPSLRECAATGVRAAVVLSAGFRESGEAGVARETALRSWLAAAPLRLIGPNCLGWIRPSRRLNLTFAQGMPQPGAVGFVSQSGALCTAVLDWSRDHALGFSLFASLGNEADVNEAEVIEALARDEETRVIIAYVEGVADGGAFRTALAAAAAAKPTAVLKAGRSVAGARAVSSHTGALAGSDRAFDAAVRQAGAVRAETVEELFDIARLAVAGRLPRSRRVVFVTNGGGLGILAADAAAVAALEVASLDRDATARLRAVTPPQAAVGNPVDLLGDAPPSRYSAALEALGADAASTVVMLAPQAITDAAGVARAVISATRGWSAPVVGVFAGGPRVRPGVHALEDAGIPCFDFPDRAMRAVAALATLQERRATSARASAPPIDVDAARAAIAALPIDRALGLVDLAPVLGVIGIATVPALRVPDAEAATAAARTLGFPVALKIDSPDLSHKSDVGGVVLGLRHEAAIRAAAAAMLARIAEERPEARVEGFVVQAMADPAARELLLGAVRDPQFGPLVVVGLGGIYVEVLRDTATCVAPIGAREAHAMLSQLRAAPILAGGRGRPAVDDRALAEAIARFSRLLSVDTTLAELEINPLLASPRGVCALDARARRTATPAGAGDAGRSSRC